ncbi:MAG: 30S ribosomal protein S16 [Thiotrichales bacterium]|nr:MAG: 30S ribosomal protein S16 [Thiotrichales bacterium]
MIMIRLARHGAKKRPFYRIVVATKTSPRDGRFIENIGFFNPIASGKAERLRMKLDRVEHWVSCGAQLSDRVRSLVKEIKKAEAGVTTAKATVAKTKSKKTATTTAKTVTKEKAVVAKKDTTTAKAKTDESTASKTTADKPEKVAAKATAKASVKKADTAVKKTTEDKKDTKK